MKKRGIILIASYLALFVALAVAATLFSRTIYEGKLVQRLKDETSARNEAEYGLKCMYYELKMHNWDFEIFFQNNLKKAPSQLLKNKFSTVVS